MSSLSAYPPDVVNLGLDELLPQEGKDDNYDAIAEEIDELEAKLEKQLKKLEDEVGYVDENFDPSNLG